MYVFRTLVYKLKVPKARAEGLKSPRMYHKTVKIYIKHKKCTIFCVGENKHLVGLYVASASALLRESKMLHGHSNIETITVPHLSSFYLDVWNVC